ncbi:Hint domain-containing protein [Pseudoalteromonas fenneropenaei]|uniref:Hint domain-containing protein n=1 Tax=Pseudoalteromonas fenneropenaei TaxID=1737459 RepID=A0ABV7CLU7_9GAMM
MNKPTVRKCVPMLLALSVSHALYAAPQAEASTEQTTTIAVVQGPAAEQGTRITTPNEQGVRELDMTNPQHYALAKSRLHKAKRTKDKFPQLHKSLDILKSQQKARKTLMSAAAVPPVDASQLDIIKDAHLFLDMNVAVSTDNNEPYLMVRAKSSRFGGTQATYIDILLEDANGNQIAPLGSTMNVLDGKDTLASSVVSLKTLKQQFPNLETIYASSYVELENEDGTISSTIKYTEYPFSWEHINAAYGTLLPQAKGVAALTDTESLSTLVNDGRPRYVATAPVDKNNDAVIKICLNRQHADCDYAADQVGDANEITDVNIPFNGEIRVGHEITEIYPTNLPIDQRPNGVDELTNIYLQEGNYGGATKQSYLGLNNTIKHFSDYLEVEVDTVNQESIIRWNIPRAEGRFGNAKLFSNIAQANWYMTFAVKGFPYFKRRGANAEARPFQISITSEQAARFGNYYSEVLPPMKLGYSCLATGTLITMADGQQQAIETIKKGDLVRGALAQNPHLTEAMTVIDVSVGIEAIQMYRVKGTKHSYILMTETHPVSTVNKGIIWAKELEPGDQILTEKGSILVKEVTKEQYKDKIYNLKLAPKEGSQFADTRNFAMFANGLAVGDLSTQDEFNYKDQNLRLTPEEILERLPEKWKTDYLNSLN